MNLDELSRDELSKLRKDVDRALDTLETRRKAEARKAAEEAALKHGFDLAELLGTDTKTKKTAKKNPPKYRNPEDPTQTWTGRGRQPAWIKSAIESGTNLDAFEI
jgi:DNA-binding protein H-NS